MQYDYTALSGEYGGGDYPYLEEREKKKEIRYGPTSSYSNA